MSEDNMKTQKKSIKSQLQELDIDLMENVSFDDTYCPSCEEPVATRTATKPYEIRCRFCNLTFTEN